MKIRRTISICVLVTFLLVIALVNVTPARSTAWWQAVAGKTPIIAYAPKGAASYSNSLINLANPGTNNAAAGIAPTWNASDGWIFNGTSQYLVTGNVTLTEHMTFVVRYSNIGGTFQEFIDDGAVGEYSLDLNISQSRVAAWFSGGVYYYSVINESMGSIPAMGVYAANPDGLWIDGIDCEAAIYSDPGTWSTSRSLNIGGSPSTYYFTGDIQAVAIYDSVLSAAEIVTITDAMETVGEEPPTDTPTATATETTTSTETSTITLTPSDTPTITLTPSDTPTITLTPTDTPTFTLTPTETSTNTPTEIPTVTLTPTATELFYVENSFTYQDVVSTILFAAMCGILILGFGVLIVTQIKRSK
jgi:hypothetical protein